MAVRYSRSTHSTVKVTCCWMTSATEVGKLMMQAPVGNVSRPPPHVGPWRLRDAITPDRSQFYKNQTSGFDIACRSEAEPR